MSDKSLGIITWVIACTMIASTAGGVYAVNSIGNSSSAEDLIRLAEGSMDDANIGIPEANGSSEIQDSKNAKPKRDSQEYREVYYTFDDPLLANVSNSQKYIQANIALLIEDTKKDTISAILTDHNFALRNVMLDVLSSQPEAHMLKPQWRDELRAELLAAANRVIEPKTGHPEIKGVFFSQFVVQ
jgi:flagellar basal body-associated protein FliL